MTRRLTNLDEMLAVDHDDPGCAGGGILDAYVELELAGENPALTYPGWSIHLQSCPGCRTDYEGLVEAVRLFGDDDTGE